jgi:plastocyanin
VRVGVSLAVLLAVLAVLAATAGASRADNPVLTGDVGINDSFQIQLADPSGAPISHVAAGTYTLLVHDHSTFHNFHLSGPGVDVKTDIDGTGDSTFTVTLTDGTYFFQCDPHSGQMHGSFTVGSVTAPPPTTTPTPAPLPTKLTAAIGSGGAVSLRPLAGLSAGTFLIAVSDRSRSDGFRLAGPGIAKATGAAFRGTVTWRVKLAAGRYSFGSALHPKLRHSFTVSA